MTNDDLREAKSGITGLQQCTVGISSLVRVNDKVTIDLGSHTIRLKESELGNMH